MKSHDPVADAAQSSAHVDSSDGSWTRTSGDRHPEPAPRAGPTLSGHVELMRVDHWTKNVFVLPGLVVAWSIDPATWRAASVPTIALGLLAVCLVASSNYVLNELLDSRFDRYHRTKQRRAFPEGRVRRRLAYGQWLALVAAAVGLASSISATYAGVIGGFALMGGVYNVPPLRTKDIVYIDVLSEAANNPLRLLAGWYLTGTLLLPPTSLMVSYWMAGAYFMALKRLAEYRSIGDHERSALYRRSFRRYSERRLLTSAVFYGLNAMLFLGAFIMRYRLELILAFPLVALVLTAFLSLAFDDDSSVQRPEHLYREPVMAVCIAACVIAMVVLLFVDVPLLHAVFQTSRP